jgi:hypothetical protein
MLNIIPNSVFNPISTYVQSDFNLLIDVQFTKPLFNGIVGGSLDAGCYTYSYQLYKLYGQETAFSPVGELIPISTNLDYPIQGSNRDTNSGKGINVLLTGLPTNFTNVRLVAIQYTDLNITPTIRIVADIDIPSGSNTLNIIDTGQSLGSYTVEEFRTLNTQFLIPATLESYKNYLFLADIKEDVFWNQDLEDWDARAYRFIGLDVDSVNRYGYIYDSSGNQQLYLNGTNYNWVEKDWDCVNPYNDIANDSDIGVRFKYQSNGATLGGEGINISYYFTLEDWPIDIFLNTSFKESVGITDNEHQLWLTGGRRGFTRGDVYRFGIVFYDKYGRSSFAKWIGDIRMPEINDGNISYIQPLQQENLITISGNATNVGETLTINIDYGGSTHVYTYTTTLLNEDTGTLLIGLESLLSADDNLILICSIIPDVFNNTITLEFNDNQSHIVTVSDVSSADISESLLQAYAPGYYAVIGSQYYLTKEDNNTLYARHLLPVFQVGTLPTGAISYKIVYVKRSDGDKNVVSSGIGTGLSLNQIGVSIYGALHTLEPNLDVNQNATLKWLKNATTLTTPHPIQYVIDYTSPQTHFQNVINDPSADYIDLVGCTIGTSDNVPSLYALYINDNTNGTNNTITATVDGVTVAGMNFNLGFGNLNLGSTISFIVPNGASYTVTASGAALVAWAEFR